LEGVYFTKQIIFFGWDSVLESSCKGFKKTALKNKFKVKKKLAKHKKKKLDILNAFFTDVPMYGQ
jgi:hypothetical protein